MTITELIVEARDGVGHLVLNRPRAINALTPGMLSGIHAALDDWASDGATVRVEISGAGERGLCSGADVRALREHVLAGGDFMEFFEVEYAMNSAIKSFPKPYVAHMRGVTMGGGLGVSAHGSRRIAYPDSVLAMPETIIGFTPDVGILWYLAQAPGQLGTHVALTGNPINAADAVLVGLADEVDETEGEAPGSVLAGWQGWIDACYASDDPAAIVQALEAHDDPDARATAADLRKRCPLSVAATLEAIRRAKAMSGVDEVLAQDMVLARHLIPRPDFAEGVRAQLVDKDRNPTWQHARIEDVTRDEVLACFEP
ncbi:enoyl-CoA hydratase/isomerase family protein [Propioniciclava sinopodophylli]|uniref:3-hydroxyisobutyryl-CoA hydrolase n=1 Tax=Propioniciclava sinopodophylli TaxID=1837344 RepID=A0A4Q9KCM2_9ACTN|nr:enoyl-CoA hydratase/isomerase family protein [Propioniciclava sinopodophylli]TBT84030.1 enoyl-CoA hydratase/isomerase family protein [Propioniciclava sinopodophylli]